VKPPTKIFILIYGILLRDEALACQRPSETTALKNDPKSVKIDITGGTGVEIVWKDGSPVKLFVSSTCAMHAPVRFVTTSGTKLTELRGEPPALAPGALPMFKAKARPTHAEPVGRYAIRFVWNDGHELGIYSWPFLREHCPCDECRGARTK